MCRLCCLCQFSGNVTRIKLGDFFDDKSCFVLVFLNQWRYLRVFLELECLRGIVLLCPAVPCTVFFHCWFSLAVLLDV